MSRMLTIAALIAAPAALLGAVLGFAAARAAADPVVTETREVAGFDEVELQGVGTLVIAQGETEALTIEAAERVLPKIATEVVAGRLTIRPDRSFQTDEPIVYSLTVTELTAVELDGAGRVEASELTVDGLELVVDGAGEVELDELTAETLAVVASGTAEIELSGAVDRQEVELDGASEYNAEDLASREARIVVDGAGEAVLRVSETLDVHVDGAGSVEYIGNPTVSQDVSIAGEVTAIGPADDVEREQVEVIEVVEIGEGDQCVE